MREFFVVTELDGVLGAASISCNSAGISDLWENMSLMN